MATLRYPSAHFVHCCAHKLNLVHKIKVSECFSMICLASLHSFQIHLREWLFWMKYLIVEFHDPLQQDGTSK